MQTHLSVSTRFVLAVLRLGYDILQANKIGWGQAIINILQEQYPEMKREMAEDPQYAENPAASIGNKLFAIARKQMQYREVDAQDPVNEFVAYISPQIDPHTKKVLKPAFDFKKETRKGKPGAATWRQALSNIYANMRARAMSHSFKSFKEGKTTDEELYSDMMWRRNQAIQGNTRYNWTDDDDVKLEELGRKLLDEKVDLKKIVPTKLRRKNVRDKSLDEAFGKRGEEGGAPEGGTGRIPQTTETTEGMAVDDKAAKKSFLESLDRLVPDMRRNLPLAPEPLPGFPKGVPAQRFLFDFIFEEDGSGTFLPDIKANMGQATAFRDYLEEISTHAGPNAEEAAAILNRHAKGGKSGQGRWSGFVGDTRVRLMKSIQEFVEEYSTEEEYEQLWKEFFSDVTPREVEKFKESRELETMKKQRGLDLRKILRFETRDRLNMLGPKEKTELKKLRQRVNEEINNEVVEKTKQAEVKHQKDLEKYNKDRDAYLANMMRVEHLPPEKQPRFPRPNRPQKPDPKNIRDSIPSLDEQLKAVKAESGEDIERGAFAELEHAVHHEERKREEQELAESIADEAISEVDARHGVAAFFKRFMPDWA